MIFSNVKNLMDTVKGSPITRVVIVPAVALSGLLITLKAAEMLIKKREVDDPDMTESIDDLTPAIDYSH